ncbi:MAG: hypothetical protein QXO21_00930 [Candidatus Anstonellales archaeon]
MLAIQDLEVGKVYTLINISFTTKLAFVQECFTRGIEILIDNKPVQIQDTFYLVCSKYGHIFFDKRHNIYIFIIGKRNFSHIVLLDTLIKLKSYVFPQTLKYYTENTQNNKLLFTYSL